MKNHEQYPVIPRHFGIEFPTESICRAEAELVLKVYVGPIKYRKQLSRAWVRLSWFPFGG
ncbi:hypothetical protein BDN67DRAFT_972112 [Paxillus ammoniavirescens]|nr:hypothetical protein BDN67DRAFT_972112 [Paxillus ammoniavirescens]